MSPLVVGDGLGFAGRLDPTRIALGAGELVCLIGPNGSGKTSLLHAIAGIGKPQGMVRIDGIDPWLVPPPGRSALLSYLPASRDIPWPLAARDLAALGLPASAVGAGLAEWVASLKLEPLLARNVGRLSTGERSRLLIARALAADSRLLLLDEPTANLDPFWQLLLMDKLRQHAERSGCALLLAVHDLEIARRYADRLLVMNAGRIEAEGLPADVIAGPDIPRIFGIEPNTAGWQLADGDPKPERRQPSQ